MRHIQAISERERAVDEQREVVDLATIVVVLLIVPTEYIMDKYSLSQSSILLGYSPTERKNIFIGYWIALVFCLGSM